MMVQTTKSENDFLQGCGLGLDASVLRPSRGAVVPRLGLASVEISNASVRLGLERD